MELKKAEGGQASSKEIKQEETTNAVKFLQQNTLLKRKFDDQNPPARAAPTQPSSCDGICAPVC